MRFMLKVGIIEAIQYKREENISAVSYFFEQAHDPVQKFRYQEMLNEYAVLCQMPSGEHYMQVLEPGDYILRHVDGRYEVMPEEIFKKRYERVSADA